MQMLTVRSTMSDGARRTIAVVMPDDSSGAQIHAETARKLREQFKVAESILTFTVIRRDATHLRAFT